MVCSLFVSFVFAVNANQNYAVFVRRFSECFIAYYGLVFLFLLLFFVQFLIFAFFVFE
jgi:hypothetical protein